MRSNGLKSGTPTPVLGVIDAETNTWIANIPTGPNAHSVAANPINNEVFVPLMGMGIAVFTHDEHRRGGAVPAAPRAGRRL